MGYLKEIRAQIRKRDFSKFLLLWEEYCSDDKVDVEEYAEILQAIKKSDFALPFGKYVQSGLSLWQLIDDEEDAYRILRLIIDLQTVNTPELAEAALNAIEKKYASDPDIKERLRLIGLRPCGDFQGALGNYDLLAHMAVGKCVFHLGGWGTGEIVEVSAIREQLAVEFEYLAGRKLLTFQNAFKNLTPLNDEHFLARRFIDPDNLEDEAKQDPIKVIKILLRDLGPLNAAEIKDELCELVIPEKEWTKWWQNARARIKKDTFIETPSALKDPFVLRKKAVTHEEQLQKEIHATEDISELVQTSYNYVRDFPNMLRKEDVKNSIKDQLIGLLDKEDLKPYQELQIYIFLENLLSENLVKGKSVKEIIVLADDVEGLVDSMEIISFKKRALLAIRKYREDWVERFLSLLTTIQQSQLRDYLLKELAVGDAKEKLVARLEELLHHPSDSPETFVWYFQKLVSKGSKDLPFSNKEGVCSFFEGFLILLHKIENNSNYRDLTKKMHQMATAKRYELIRKVIEGTSLHYVKEFLLLASKCHTFSSHDHKILLSLAQVVHPSLAPDRKVEDRLQLDGRVMWTTEEGFKRTQERAQQIGTVEIVENAREVEAARALGDLRENSEYKFAVEKRRQLQGELKKLSEELNRARIITESDIDSDEIGIGNVVTIIDQTGKESTFTILGPWDANPEKNILSFQSKLAQAMIGRKVDDKFSFRDEEYRVMLIGSYLAEE